MKSKTYFRASLLIPLALPIVLYPLGVSSGITSGAIFILLASLVFAGVPYLLFGAILFLWLGKMSSIKKMKTLTYITPLLFIPFYSIIFFPWAYFFDDSSFSFDFFLGSSMYILLLGYGYVIIVNMGYLLLNRYEILHEE